MDGVISEMTEGMVKLDELTLKYGKIIKRKNIRLERQDPHKIWENFLTDQKTGKRYQRAEIEEEPTIRIPEFSGVNREKATKQKLKTWSIKLQERKMLNRIANAINTEPPYPTSVWLTDSEFSEEACFLYKYLNQERYSRARALFLQYKERFPKSFLRKPSAHTQLLTQLEEIVFGVYDEKLIDSIPEEQFYGERLEPRIHVTIYEGGEVKIDEFEPTTSIKDEKFKKIKKVGSYFNLKKGRKSHTQDHQVNITRLPIQHGGSGQQVNLPNPYSSRNFPIKR